MIDRANYAKQFAQECSEIFAEEAVCEGCKDTYDQTQGMVPICEVHRYIRRFSAFGGLL